MPLKNTVAAERRMDLASLFCMIGRHGPAVALAVIAMVSVLAGFIIYRNVRGKRRKAAAADGDGKCPGEERDTSVMQPSSEESNSSTESTDVSDEGSSDLKEDDDLIKSDLEIRHRRVAAAAAAEKKPPPSPPASDIQVPESQHTTSDDIEEIAVGCDSSEVAEMCEEEANQGLSSVAELVVEDAVECHQGATADIVEDFIEEVRVNDSCLREPEPIMDDNHEEEEKVIKAERQKNEDVDTEKDVSDKKTRPEEENFQSASNNLVGFEQTPQMGDKGDNDKLQDNQTPLQKNNESNSEESAIHIEDVTAPCICYDKDTEFEAENIDSFDDSGYTGNNDLSPEEEEKNDSEKAEEECVHLQVISQQAEIMSITCEQETNLSSTQQNQCDHVVDTVVSPTGDSDLDEDDVLAGEVTEEIVDEDQLNELTPVIFDTHSPQCEEEATTELKKETGLTPNQEDFALCDGTDQMKEKMLSSDNIVASSQENESSNVALPSLSEAVKVDNSEDSLSDINTDVEAQISGTADFLDLSSVCPPKEEDKIGLSLDVETDFTVTGPRMSSQETEDLPEDNRNDRIGVLSEECRDQDYDPHVQSCYKDKQNVQMINVEVSDKTSVAVDTNSAQNTTASVKVEEISHLPSICQEQQSGSIENNDVVDQMRIKSATDAADCNNASLPAFVMSEDISHPDISSSIQDQQSDHMENDKDFTEVTTVTALDITHDNMTQEISRPMCHIYLPSFKANEQISYDISSPGDGEESGISSMVVSPDLQDAGNEFEVTAGNVLLPVRDCDLQSEEQTEAQNSLLADDVTMSVISEDTAAMVFEPYLSSCSKDPCSEHTDGIKYESYAANEDMFGHEIEDGYHKALDQFTAQIAASMTTHTDDPKIQPDTEAVVEVVEIKKDTAVSVKQKGDTKAEKEKEKEEDYEKTEISIMEATMDNNEWITDSNYQVLPWLNLSSTSFAQDHTKTKQVPTDECQCSSAVTDDTCVVTTDIQPDVNQTSPIPLVDENMETNKKVVAVQPMPQNVNVTFRVHYFTQSPYQTVAVTGNQEELGNWKGFVPLERSKDGHWVTVVSLPVESHVEWKFVVVDKGEVCRWEECGNRLLDTGYGDDLLVHKWWGLL